MKLSDFFDAREIVRDAEFTALGRAASDVPGTLAYAETVFYVAEVVANPQVAAVLTTRELADESPRGLRIGALIDLVAQHMVVSSECALYNCDRTEHTLFLWGSNPLTLAHQGHHGARFTPGWACARFDEKRLPTTSDQVSVPIEFLKS